MPVIVVAMLTALLPGHGNAADESRKVAFHERFMIRLSSYNIQDADTEITVLSSGGLGTGFSFADDLGGDTNITTLRIDAYYRFNERHRIEFSSFQIERSGRELLKIEVDLEDQTYNVGETVVSAIDYDLLKIGYVYSFYHSPTVELGVTAGLNVTNYEFDYELADGSSANSSDVNAPLPMFGLRVSYAINSRWSLHYLSESFYIKVDDALSGAFISTELNIQYKFKSNFVLGAGLTRFSTDLTSKDSDWKGRIEDTHRGVLLFGSYYL